VTRARTARPGEVTYPHSGGVRSGVSVATTSASAATLATSLPPPEPTRNGPPGTRVELMLPKRSTWAPPRHATVVVPGPPTRDPRTRPARPTIGDRGKLRWLRTNGSAGVGS